MSILFAVYQSLLGQSGLFDRYIDQRNQADSSVLERLEASQSVPSVRLQDAYLTKSATELAYGDYDQAVLRVAQSMRQADDGDEKALSTTARKYMSEQKALSRADRRALLEQASSFNREQLMTAWTQFMQQRHVNALEIPDGLSDAELYRLYAASIEQLGSMPLQSVVDSSNGGSMSFEVSDTGSVAEELYAKGLAVGVTYRSESTTHMRILYVPKHNYPVLGQKDFQGTLAHEMAHGLNLDVDVQKQAAARRIDVFGSSSPASTIASVGYRFVGQPKYESLYAQQDQSEDIAESYRAIMSGDVPNPNHVRSFESLLGTKKLMLLAQLEYRYPGFTAFALTNLAS